MSQVERAGRTRYWIAGGLVLVLVIVGVWWFVSARGEDVVGSGRFESVEDSTYGGVEEIVAELEAGGLACEDLNVSNEAQTEEVGAEFGNCTVGSDTVNIHVYDDPSEVLRHIEGNFSVRKEKNPNYFTSGVYGTNWVVDTYSVQTSIRAKQALGGTIY